MAIIIETRNEVIALANENKFVVTEKDSKSVTMTIRIYPEINAKLERLALKSKRSRNELINKALEFALNNLEFISNDQ